MRASKTRFSVVDRLLEQLPRERMLGVVLNRAESQPDETALYYQQRYQQRLEAEEEAAGETEAVESTSGEQMETIYLEEDMVS